jgi:hypothetical protein
MCPSGQATIRTGCTPDQESGSRLEEDRWGEEAVFEKLMAALRQRDRNL